MSLLLLFSGPGPRYLVMDADAGSYSVSGVNPTLSRTYIMVLDSGGYAISGIDASLLQGHLLSADVGSYNIAGVVPSFIRGYLIAPDIGSYAVTGANAGLFQGYGMLCDIGTYQLTGQSADLRLWFVPLHGGEYNLEIHKGETFSFGMAIADDNGAVMHLTGYTARMDIRRKSGEVLVSAHSSAGDITINESLGTVTVSLSSAKTAALPPNCKYDLFMIHRSLERNVLVYGDIKVNPRITVV